MRNSTKNSTVTIFSPLEKGEKNNSTVIQLKDNKAILSGLSALSKSAVSVFLNFATKFHTFPPDFVPILCNVSYICKDCTSIKDNNEESCIK